MDGPSANQSSTYRLPLTGRDATDGNEVGDEAAGSLPEPVLIENVLWFCQLRWLVVALLGGFGIVSFVPGVFASLGLRPDAAWSLGAAIVVAVANAVFLAHAGSLQPNVMSRGAVRSLWIQIVVDLAVLTAVVHFVGRASTHVMFAYLFHIVLACIFFSRRQSLLVVLLASSLFTTCLLIEETGVLPPTSVFAATGHAGGGRALEIAVNAASGQMIWIVVWFLASRLSEAVRARDRTLARTNRRLLIAQEERADHMLRTTHELKAPFAAIYSNAQLLTKGRCGELPEKAKTVVGRIAARSRRLAREIQDMLQLANLSSPSGDPLPPVSLDLGDELRWSVDQARPLGEERGVEIVLDLQPGPRTVNAVSDHLKMAFSNLLTNAVTYSHEGGTVTVTCAASAQGSPLVRIRDQGIGIPPDKLPHIFDEYYRTEEAVGHWPESTGLGLSIVRHVAGTYNIAITVSSCVGEGTTFELEFRT